MPNNELWSRNDSDLVPLQAELPTVPDAFRRTDYEGWLSMAEFLAHVSSYCVPRLRGFSDVFFRRVTHDPALDEVERLVY